MVINGQENMTTKLVIMNIMLLHPVLDSGAVFNALVGKLMHNVNMGSTEGKRDIVGKCCAEV